MVDVARRRTGRGAVRPDRGSGFEGIGEAAGRLLRGVDDLARRAPIAFGLAAAGAGLLLGFWTGSRRRQV